MANNIDPNHYWESIRAASRVNRERRNSAILAAYATGLSIAYIAHAARISTRQVGRIVRGN